MHFPIVGEQSLQNNISDELKAMGLAFVIIGLFFGGGAIGSPFLGYGLSGVIAFSGGSVGSLIISIILWICAYRSAKKVEPPLSEIPATITPLPPHSPSTIDESALFDTLTPVTTSSLPPHSPSTIDESALFDTLTPVTTSSSPQFSIITDSSFQETSTHSTSTSSWLSSFLTTNKDEGCSRDSLQKKSTIELIRIMPLFFSYEHLENLMESLLKEDNDRIVLDCVIQKLKAIIDSIVKSNSYLDPISLSIEGEHLALQLQSCFNELKQDSERFAALARLVLYLNPTTSCDFMTNFVDNLNWPDAEMKARCELQDLQVHHFRRRNKIYNHYYGVGEPREMPITISSEIARFTLDEVIERVLLLDDDATIEKKSELDRKLRLEIQVILRAYWQQGEDVVVQKLQTHLKPLQDDQANFEAFASLMISLDSSYPLDSLLIILEKLQWPDEEMKKQFLSKYLGKCVESKKENEQTQLNENKEQILKLREPSLSSKEPRKQLKEAVPPMYNTSVIKNSKAEELVEMMLSLSQPEDYENFQEEVEEMHRLIETTLVSRITDIFLSHGKEGVDSVVKELQPLFDRLKGESAKFETLIDLTAHQNSGYYSLNFTVAVLEKLRWPDEERKKQFLPECLGKCIANKYVVWYPHLPDSPLKIDEYVFKMEGLLGRGDDIEPLSDYLVQAIGYSIESLSKPTQEYGINIVIASEENRLLPASMIAPILPCFTGISKLVALKLSPTTGFSQYDAGALLRIVETNPQLHDMDINIDGMTEEQQTAFMQQVEEIEKEQFESP